MPNSSLPRRGFLARLATGTLALSGIAALDPRLAHAVAREVPDIAGGGAPGDYDDSWTRRVSAAAHKAVFDGPELAGGLPIIQAWIYRSGYAKALGATGVDVLPVVVLRHMGTELALDDAIWAKYGLGAQNKVNDPVTKQPAVRNPWSRTTSVDVPDANIAALLGPGVDATVEGLVKSGAVVLTCELALRSFSRALAAKHSGNADAIFAELRAGLVPGVIVQPSGVYATIRAQEAGAAVMRST